MADIGPDGHPIPEKQGVVVGYIQPIVFRDPKQGDAGAIGMALDADGNPIEQTDAWRAEFEAKLLAEKS